MVKREEVERGLQKAKGVPIIFAKRRKKSGMFR